MKLKALFAALILSGLALAQTAPPSPFAASTMSFNLSQISLPGQQQTLAGMETDAMITFSEYFNLGETTVISTSPFIGGRVEFVIPQVAKYLQNHTSLTGANFQFGYTGSAGVVKSAIKSTWGERAGIFLKYAPAGNQNFNLGVDVEWNNMPYVDPSNKGYGHHVLSVAVGPAFRF